MMPRLRTPPAKRHAFMVNQAALERLRTKRVQPREAEDAPKCGACDGEGVDAFGFDCATCFGTGEPDQ